ncbi:MAG: hypothetical protein AAFY99_04765 [Pseudomonadota bacterium]
MIGFLVVFIGVILLFAILFIEIIKLDGKAIKEGYGPKKHVQGISNATGKLVCVSANAPTLNRSISFPYALNLNFNKGKMSGTYEYRARRSQTVETVYNGELFLSFDRDKVKGRSMMAGLKTIEGILDTTKARLKRGHPKKSMLSFLNGPFEYSLNSGKVRFEKTTLAGNISDESDLRVQGNRITGRVYHGPQKTWAVEVDVIVNKISVEKAALAVILACNDILCVHHGD